MSITGPHTVGFDLTARIAEALTIAAGQTVLPFYGEIVEIEELDIKTETDTVIYVGVQNRDTKGILSGPSGQVITEGTLFIYVWALSGHRTIEKTTEIFRNFNYVTENGAIGKPPQAPWEIGNLTVWRFDPVDGFNMDAENWENMFLNRELIDFAIRVN